MYGASQSRFAYLWPPIVDKASAEQAAKLGYYGAVWAAVGSAVLFVLSMAGVTAGNEYGWLDAIVFAILAWRIRKFSKIAISIAFGLFSIAFVLLMAENQNGAHAAGGGFAGLWLLNGARGIFSQYRKVAAEAH